MSYQEKPERWAPPKEGTAPSRGRWLIVDAPRELQTWMDQTYAVASDAIGFGKAGNEEVEPPAAAVISVSAVWKWIEDIYVWPRSEDDEDAHGADGEGQGGDDDAHEAEESGDQEDDGEQGDEWEHWSIAQDGLPEVLTSSGNGPDPVSDLLRTLCKLTGFCKYK
ncbi:MAG: hypothetical protein QM619_10990 [Micropruina sp.]|uniref:hypothetical protein n=1 Tax=Micropruina sp. TaxID=2737536 RepID=UPI0039E54B07